MEGAILSTSSSTRFRAHLKNAANAICAKTLPKQRRSEGTASTTVQHHTYPRATTPKQVSMAFRIESPKCDKVQQPSPFDIQEHEPFFPVPKSSCNGTTQFNGNHTYPRSTPPKRAAISCRAESPKCDPTRQESPFDEQEHVPQVVPDVKSNSNGTNQLTGKLAREVASAWGCRVGAPGKPAPVDCIQSLFNDIELYPTKTQVFEMLVCARKCARRKSLTLTFGEFCLFAAELRRCSRQARQTPTKPESPIWSSDKEARDKDTTCKHVNGSEASPPPCEVFLGGSCNPTTWRSDIAIPMLTKMGITYFNPQVEDWSTELVEVEHRAKAAARALLFVLDSETRAVAASVEAAHLAAAPRDLLLVLRPYSRHQKVGNESLSDHEYVELSRARATLQEAVERRGLPAFTDIPAALSCARAVLRGARTHPRHSLGHTILRLKRAYDAAGGRNAMLSRTRAVEALREVTRAPLELVERCLPPAMEPVDFESFCAAVAELAADAEYQTRSSTEAEAVADAGAGEARGEESPRENVRHAYNARLRACGRKLALFIPKNGGRAPADSPAEGAGSDAVLTPGTARRLERLPAMLGAPAHDVYLAGALQSNSSRPEEILRREGFTYVIPRANDYTRMFSAPARRSAPAHPESPRRDKKPRNTSDGDSRSHEGRSHDSRSHEAAEEDVEVRERSAREPSDRLSASDFYNVSEDLTPQPFKGTYDEDLLLGSRVLVFWLSAEAPCFAAMVLAAHYMGLRPNATVLIVQALDPAKATLYSEVAVKDYNRGRHYLTDLARRSGVPVFDNVDAAMACVVSRLKATHL